ncbi:hypothetical protein AVEN_254289-1 [Araneus ventricosus]|uniref:Uncharacterized protein n=1 Tax=Araneus ventricosus TaxID=182803 RepID=A0A4Y2FA21_ARAVE|nr:hypothetical protein AVEN_254289-1 [Araneus ventricosus]
MVTPDIAELTYDFSQRMLINRAAGTETIHSPPSFPEDLQRSGANSTYAIQMRERFRNRYGMRPGSCRAGSHNDARFLIASSGTPRLNEARA